MLLYRYFLFTMLSFLILPIRGISQNNFAIIPKPTRLDLSSGIYKYAPTTAIVVSPEFKDVASLLADHPGINRISIKEIGSGSIKALGEIAVLKATSRDNHINF